MKNVYFNLNQMQHPCRRTMVGWTGTPSENREKTEPRECGLTHDHHGTISYAQPNHTPTQPWRESGARVAKYVAMLFAVLVMSIGQAWGEDITIMPTYTNRYLTMPYGLVNVTGSVTPNSSAVYSAASKGGTFTLDFVTTKSDMYIKSVTFNTVNNGTLSSADGTITSNILTVSGDKDSVRVTMTSTSGQKGSLKITNIVVNTGSNDVETLTAFSVSTSTVSATAKMDGSSITSAVSMTTTGSASDGKLSIPNNGTITFTSSSNILYIAFFNPDNKILQSSKFQVNSTQLTTGTWSGSAKTVEVSNKTGAARNISHIWVITESAVVKDYTVTAATSTGTNTYGTVSAAASSLDEDETTTITATPAAGYQVTNWAVSGTGASISPDGASNSNTTTLTMGTANATVTATFGLKSYTVTLNNQSATSAGTESVTTTYNASTNLTSAITCPTKTGKVFAGYFTAANGGGTQLIDPAGNWIASAGGGSTYLDASKNWKNDGNLTLYACWMEYANSLDLQNYVETSVGSSAGDGKTSTTWTYLTGNNYICSLSGSTALDNSTDAAYRGLKFKTSGNYVLFLVPANYSLSVKWGYVKTTKPKYSINGGAAQTFSTLSTGADNTSSPGDIEISSQSYIQLVKIMSSDGDAAVLKKVTITAPACTTPTASWSTAPADGTAGGNMNASLTTNYAAGVVYTSSNTDVATVSGNGTTTCAINYVAAGTARITATVTGDGSTICAGPATCYTDITVSAPVASTWYVKGDWNEWGTSTNLTGEGSELTATATLSANTQYGFKVHNTSGDWHTNTGTIKGSVTNWDFSTTGGSDNNCYIRTSCAGTYTFTYNTSTNKLSVVYPESHKMYFYKDGASWSRVYAYCYDDEDWNNGWPGYEITSNTECETFYAYSDGYTYMIFNNGSSGEGNQTGNLTVGDNAGKCAIGAAAESWSAKPTYTVSYNGNGGTGTTDSNTGIACGGSQTLRSNNFTRDGWTFTGWNTNKYGTGDAYAAGAAMNDIEGNVTLYAQWEKVIYMQATGDLSWWYDGDAWFAVYYWDNSANSNNGYVTMSLVDCTTNVYKATIPGNGYDKLLFLRMNPDYSTPSTTTGKWNQTSNCAYPTTDPKFTINGGSDQDCTGSWGSYSAPSFAISYAKGSPSASISGSKDNESKSCGVDFTLPSSAVFTRTGYTQTGWATSDGGDKAYNLGGSYTTDAAQTFYPFWTVNGHTLTWSFDGGDCDETAGEDYTAGGTVNYGTTINYPSNSSMSKTGYTFTGWSSNPSTMPDEDLTLTAQWTANTYDVAFTLSNAAYSSGTNEGDDVASYGTDYEVVFAASSGYILPSDVTVTIGGESTTKGTEYTWNSSTGALTIYGTSVLGNISITVAGEEITYCYEFAPSKTSGSIAQYEVITTSTGGIMEAATDKNSYDTNGLLFGSNSSTYVEVALENNMQAGTVIEAVIYNSNNDKARGLNLANSSGTSKATWTATKIGDHEETYTVVAGDGLAGSNIFRIYRNNNAYLKTLKISNCGSDATKYDVTHTLTNVTKSSGLVGTGVAVVGGNYTAVFEASDCYLLPDSVSVTIGGSAKTDGTDYYWTQATGKLVIPGENVTGAIVITIKGKDNHSEAGLAYAVDKVAKGKDDEAFTNTLTNPNSLTVSYESSDEDVATVDSNGEVTIKGAGTTTITASAAAQDCYLAGEASYELTVTSCTSVAAPTSLCCSSQTGTSLTYTWTKASNASGYRATLYSDSGCESVVTYTDLNSGSTETVTFSTLTSATTYYCKVQSKGDGETYCADGGTTSAVSGTTLTVYTVTYNVNGAGSCATASETQGTSGASLTLPTPTWSGYTFDGWYNAGTKIGNGGASYTPTADITLYAHWTDNISGKVFSFIDNNYGDKFKAFDLSDWVTGNATGKSNTYENGDGVQYSVSAGCWDKKDNAISSLAKFKGGTSTMSVVIPTGKIATVKISYNAYGAGDDYRLTVNSTAQANPSTKLTDGMTNAEVIASMKEITLSNQTGTLTLGISNTEKNNYIGRVSAVITGYVVTYAKGSADGAGGDSFTGTKTAGSSFTLSSSSSAFTRDGFIYDGWSVNEDGSTKDYNLGDSYTTDAVITLYPHWAEITTFNGNVAGHETEWDYKANWSGGALPTINNAVVIENKNIIVNVGDAQAATVILSGTSTLTVQANKALVVDGKITKNGTAPTASDLLLESTSDGNATLIFDNSNSAAATVQMYSIGSTDGSNWTWQYIGVPFDGANAQATYYGAYLYKWNNGWTAVQKSDNLEMFAGYCISYPAANYTYVMDGALAPTTSKRISVAEDKSMVVGNSWTAPIQITQFEDADFSGLLKNVYLYNTGNDEGHSAETTDSPTGEDIYAAGTYISVPIHSATYLDVKVISSLQGFFVKDDDTQAGGGTLSLSYSKHVRPTGGNSVANGAMHAPKRVADETDRPAVLKMKVSGSQYDDRLILLEREDFTTGYDAGWDGDKMGDVATSPRITTTREDGTADAVAALPDLEGTLINFRAASTDDQYTLYFDYETEDAEPLYLLDLTNNAYTRVETGSSYTFFTTDKADHKRFALTRYRAPQITTGVEEAQGDNGQGKAVKFIENDKLYILRNGVLYDGTGKKVIEN